MARAMRGAGSVTRLENKERAKCRKWRLKVPTDKGLKTKRFTGTYTQAQVALDEFKEELERTRKFSSSSVPTFGEYAETWLEYRESVGELANRTIKKNRNVVRLLNWHFRDFSLTDITLAEIKKVYVKLRKGDSPSGKCLSGTYLSDTHIILNQILKNALDEKLIMENPCASKSMMKDKPKRDTPEKTPLTEDQVLQLFKAIDTQDITALTVGVSFAVRGGLRRSEICALRWCDYDGDVIDINHAAEDDGSLKDPKSDASKRQVPLDEGMKRILARWQEKQVADFLDFGIPHTSETRIVTTERFGVMQPWNLDRWWRRNRSKFGLENTTLHELRHTYLDLMVHSGAVIKDVQSIAGHADADVLMKIYTHCNREKEREAVDGMFEQLKRKGTA